MIYLITTPSKVTQASQPTGSSRRGSLTSNARSNVAIELPLARRGEGVGGGGGRTPRMLGSALLIATTMLLGATTAHAEDITSFLKDADH